MSAPDVRDLPPPPEGDEPGTTTEPRERASAATRLIDMALRSYTLGVTPSGEPFATAKDSRPHIAMKLRDGRLGLRSALARGYYQAEGKAAGQQALADALITLHGLAQDLEPREMNLRVAEHEGALWIDTGDAEGRVLRVHAGRWEVMPAAPVLFHRTELTAAMQDPARGGDVTKLFEFLNVSEPDRPLLLACLVASFLPNIPHPIPTLSGEQGTGKSTAARMLVDLMDPSAVPLRKPPRDADGLVTAFAGSWVVALDNLSAVNDWLSDSLCRAVTGEGDVRRQLYTDGGLSVFAFRRQVMLTGIDFAGLRGDLTERMVLVQLSRIDDRSRVDEQSLAERWARDLPLILGGLCDLLAAVHDRLPTIVLPSKPRMADYAKVLAAVDELLGTRGLERYTEQSAEIAADTLASSPFIERLVKTRLDFTGTAAELLTALTPPEPEWRPPREWPRNARAVTTILSRDAPALRKQGWVVDKAGEDRNHTKRWHLVHPDRAPEPDLFAESLADDEPF